MASGAWGSLLTRRPSGVDLSHKGRGDRTSGAALSSTKVGKNPASVLPAPVGAIKSAERLSRAFSNSAS